MSKYIETPKEQVVPATDEMIALRDSLCRALGFELKGNIWEGALGVCVAQLSRWSGVPAGGTFYQYPSQVTKAAHAIDKSKAPKARKATP